MSSDASTTSGAPAVPAQRSQPHSEETPADTTRTGLYGSRLGANMTAATIAELVGTFLLVFAITATVTGAALDLNAKGGAYNSLAIPLVNGIALVALVATFAHISGAHFNPAVTVALAVVRKFPWSYVPSYVLAQFAGAILAGLADWLIYGGRARVQASLGATAPGHGATLGQVFATEALITFFLVLVVIAVATDDRVPTGIAAVAVGTALAAAVFIGAPISGAGVNPARAIGPMIVAGSFTDWWVYLLAPLVGAIAATAGYDRFLRKAQAPE